MSSILNSRAENGALNGPPTYGWEWSNGKMLVIPGRINEQLLTTPEHPYGYTKSNYTVTCVGETFQVTSPEGLIYTFDVRVDETSSFSQTWTPGSASGRITYASRMLASKITDKFGNHVNYHYNDDNQLESITSSDGRRIDIKYKSLTAEVASSATSEEIHYHNVTLNVVDYIEVNGRRWEYHYKDGTFELEKVTLPSNDEWRYSEGLYKVRPEYGWNDGAVHTCYAPEQGAEVTFTVDNPQGASARFHLTSTYHGISEQNDYTISTYYGPGLIDTDNYYKSCAGAYSLTEKTITGANLTPATWRFQYSENAGNYQNQTQAAPFVGTSAHISGTSIPGIISDPKDYPIKIS